MLDIKKNIIYYLKKIKNKETKIKTKKKIGVLLKEKIVSFPFCLVFPWNFVKFPFLSFYFGN
jgi:hypothetical protein